MNHRSLRKRSGIQILAPLAGILATGAAGAAEVTLPPTVAVSIGVIAGADPIVTALAGALKKNFGTTLDMRLAAAQGYTNVLPMVRDGQVTFAGNSVLAQPYAASEGLAPMDVPSWGPQRLGVVFACRMGVNSIATAADANIRTYAALKGKRIALPPGNVPPLATAYLAFGGLTWQDVVRVDAADAAEAVAAVVANRADAFMTAPTSAQANVLAASPRGLFWPPTPAADAAGWQRLQKVTRWNERGTVAGAAGTAPGTSFEGVSTLGVNFAAYLGRDTDLVYNMTKALFSTYDDYKGAAGGIAGCNVSQQTFDGYVPWHDGAIRYFKEIGVWTDAYQKANDQLRRRQGVVADAWTKANAGTFATDAEFRAAWLKSRAAALTADGLEP